MRATSAPPTWTDTGCGYACTSGPTAIRIGPSGADHVARALAPKSDVVRASGEVAASLAPKRRADAVAPSPSATAVGLRVGETGGAGPRSAFDGRPAGERVRAGALDTGSAAAGSGRAAAAGSSSTSSEGRDEQRIDERRAPLRDRDVARRLVSAVRTPEHVRDAVFAADRDRSVPTGREREIDPRPRLERVDGRRVERRALHLGRDRRGVREPRGREHQQQGPRAADATHARRSRRHPAQDGSSAVPATSGNFLR
jgi:hypothetical protein